MSTTSKGYYKYCPVCSKRLGIRRDGGLPRLACKKCGFIFYQNSKPTASAFITDRRGRILLVKRAINPKRDWWDAAGGFLEDGEHPLKGVQRELREELGVRLKNISPLGIYMDTYRNHYTVSVLNIIYRAEIASGTMRPMDDVSEARWFRTTEIPWSRLAFRWMKPAMRDLLKVLK
ncbi:MAG: NUDIX hydrolase [Patescibacteria group bacterium]|nr:NUDIX hydrolase [Patescibacteria group bacterium]MDD5715823.1 NUDIX hydrolase [Patescibacteria group bacterium]